MVDMHTSKMYYDIAKIYLLSKRRCRMEENHTDDLRNRATRKGGIMKQEKKKQANPKRKARILKRLLNIKFFED